jgi:hypothetical protein
VQTPAWGRTAGHLQVVDDHMIDLAVPEVARTAIDNHRLAVLREDHTVDPLDGHALLCRLKTAAALMALDGRTIIDPADWKLSGYVMDVSAYTRERCRRALVDQTRSQNTACALATAEREEIMSDRRVQRARDGILRQLRQQTPQLRSALRRNLKGDIRDYFDAALEDLDRSGEVTVSPGDSNGRGSTVDLRSTLSDQQKQDVDHRSTWTTPHHRPGRSPRRRQRTRGKYRDQPQQTGEQIA